MAGAMRKAMVYLGLVEEDDRYADDYDAYDEIDDGRRSRDERYEASERAGRVERAERTQRTESADWRRDAGDGTEPRAARGSSALTAVREERRPADRAGRMPASRVLDRITTIHPRTYNEAKQIGEAFRDGTPVIMNLTDMDDSDAKRLVDFAAGLVFGRRGTIERVTNKVFLLSPADVTVTAEDKARMAESGFFNQS